MRFDPNHFEDYVGALSKLRHTTTVSAYQSDFERLLNKVTGVSESTLVSVFISGLKPQLRRELNLRRPVTLTMAFALARELSALHADNGTNSQHSSTHPVVTPPSSHPNVLVHETTHQQHASSSLTRPDLPIRRLSFAEKQVKDAQGLCYNCDQKWSRNHRCASRLLLLLGDNDEKTPAAVSTTPLDEDATMLSADLSYINSLYGTGHPRALRGEGNILNVMVHVLVDGGSNNNFVHPRIVEKLRLPVTPIPPFRVYVGNGESLPCTTQCTAVPLSLQGHTFEVDLYVLPVHGPDVLLGVQWLQTLGQVSHDYANLKMEFSWDGQQISLHGDHQSPPPNPLHSIDHIHNHSSELHLEDKVVPQVGKDDTKQPKPNVDTQPVIHKGPTT